MIRPLPVIPEAGIGRHDRKSLFMGIPPFEFGGFSDWINST
jgi:hypothetical protein